jgi:hypothetical protein
LRIALDLVQNVAAVHAGHIEIQQNQVRPWGVLERRPAVQEVEGLGAARSIVASVTQPKFSEKRPNQFQLNSIVVYEEKIQ